MAEYINPDYVPEPEKMNVKKGLEGVVACTTGISFIVGNTLIYRGYTIEDLAEHSTFEEAIYLLWNDRLPNKSELTAFKT